VLSFGYFSLHKQRKVTGVSGPPPTTLNLKLKKIEMKIQNIKILSD